MNTNPEIGKNMMLITSAFRNAKSFSLIPISLECPYVEALFDPESKILAIITKTHKGSYHMVPKLDENGDPLRLKMAKRENGKTIKEQRVLVDTFSEFYVNQEKEIEEFVKLFALNATKFDYKAFLKAEPKKNGISNLVLPAEKGITEKV